MKVPLVLPMLICAASCVAEEPPPTLERRTYIEFTEGIVISAGERSSSPRSLDGWDCIGSTCDRLINPGGTPSAAAAVFGAGLHGEGTAAGPLPARGLFGEGGGPTPSERAADAALNYYRDVQPNSQLPILHDGFERYGKAMGNAWALGMRPMMEWNERLAEAVAWGIPLSPASLPTLPLPLTEEALRTHVGEVLRRAQYREEGHRATLEQVLFKAYGDELLAQLKRAEVMAQAAMNDSLTTALSALNDASASVAVQADVAGELVQRLRLETQRHLHRHPEAWSDLRSTLLPTEATPADWVVADFHLLDPRLRPAASSATTTSTVSPTLSLTPREAAWRRAVQIEPHSYQGAVAKALTLWLLGNADRPCMQTADKCKRNLDAAMLLISFLIDALPPTGVARAIYEAFSGEDAISGTPLSESDRAIRILAFAWIIPASGWLQDTISSIERSISGYARMMRSRDPKAAFEQVRYFESLKMSRRVAEVLEEVSRELPVKAANPMVKPNFDVPHALTRDEMDVAGLASGVRHFTPIFALFRKVPSAPARV